MVFIASRERDRHKRRELKAGVGVLPQGLRWPRSAGGTGRGFGHSRLHPNWAQGPVFTASGKGTVDEAPGFLMSYFLCERGD